MATCRVCGAEFRNGDDITLVGAGSARRGVHRACVEAPTPPRRRRPGSWIVMGSRQQMEMGPAQRGE